MYISLIEKYQKILKFISNSMGILFLLFRKIPHAEHHHFHCLIISFFFILVFILHIEQRKEDDDVPNEYLCPITSEIMEDPVVAADGHSYERTAIEHWFDIGRHTSPKTNEPIDTRLIPNVQLRILIEEYHEHFA